MGVTERLARGCAARPRLTLALWGAAVLVALALVATSLHGLTSNSHVVGQPESTKAEDAVARAFPHQNPNGKGDVVVVASRRYGTRSPQFRAFGNRLAHDLRATGKVFEIRKGAVSPNGHAVLASVGITSDSGAAQVEQVVENANGGAF